MAHPPGEASGVAAVVGQEDDHVVAVDADDRGRPPPGGRPAGCRGRSAPAGLLRRRRCRPALRPGAEDERPVGLLEIVAEAAALDRQAVGRAPGEEVEEELPLVAVEQADQSVFGLEQQGQHRAGRLQRGVGDPVGRGDHEEPEELAPGGDPRHQPGRDRAVLRQLDQAGAAGPAGPEQVAHQGVARAGEGNVGGRGRRRSDNGQERILEDGLRPDDAGDGVDGRRHVGRLHGGLHHAAVGVPAVGPAGWTGSSRVRRRVAAGGATGSWRRRVAMAIAQQVTSVFPRKPGQSFS